MKTGSILTASGQLEYARWGNARQDVLPVLLFHEGLGSVGLWKDFPERLAVATGREVVAWSRHGHGDSGGGEVVHEVDYMHNEADLLPAVHEALGIAKGHWLGPSDGGSIALIASSRYPELVASLILEAPHIFVEELTVASIAKVVEGFAASDLGERMKKYHRDPVAMFHRWGRIWLEPAFLNWNIEKLLPAIEAPALLIQGYDDQYGTMEQIDGIAAVLPETTLLKLNDCRHSPHFERGEAVLDAISLFLQEKS